MSEKPRIGSAPGLVWRKLGDGTWEGIWRARPDLIERGFRPKNSSLWRGTEPTMKEVAYIADSCRRLQDEMLEFSRGGIPKVGAYTGTIKSLIECYQTDPDSTWHTKRYHVRKNHAFTLKRIVRLYGEVEIGDINARWLLAEYKTFKGGEHGIKIAMGAAFIGHLRTLFGFGATMLEDAECERLCSVLHKMRFKGAGKREHRLVADQAELIRAGAHETQHPSIAIVQAFQFELMLRQKDCIGEMVPLSEPGASDVIVDNKLKWLHGLRWSEIDDELFLRHTTSKKGKDIEVDLKLAPMVMEELLLLAPGLIVVNETTKQATVNRQLLPGSGPIVVCELTGTPWLAAEFRRKWRIIADTKGIPKEVKNMDSRSGAISEAEEAGANMNHVSKTATHSQLSTTMGYARGDYAKLSGGVLGIRVESRNKPKT